MILLSLHRFHLYAYATPQYVNRFPVSLDQEATPKIQSECHSHSDCVVKNWNAHIRFHERQKPKPNTRRGSLLTTWPCEKNDTTLAGFLKMKTSWCRLAPSHARQLEFVPGKRASIIVCVAQNEEPICTFYSICRNFSRASSACVRRIREYMRYAMPRRKGEILWTFFPDSMIVRNSFNYFPMNREGPTSWGKAQVGWRIVWTAQDRFGGVRMPSNEIKWGKMRKKGA